LCQLVVQFSWNAYCKPTPACLRELLTLFALCLGIAMINGGLLYNWMFSSLEYEAHVSGAISGVFVAVAFLLLLLVHPVRCLFTLAVPTLGTKQGRHLLLSSCFMLVAVNIIPNIVDNIKMMLKVLECITRSSSESFVNSSELLNAAIEVLGHDVKTVIKKSAERQLLSSKSSFTFNPDINQSVIMESIQAFVKQIQSEFSMYDKVFSAIILWTNRALAACICFYLVIRSAWYLNNYLTNLQFDNVYITSKLSHLVETNNQRIIPHRISSKKLIKSTGLKMSTEEIARCAYKIVIITAYMVLSIIIIVTDLVFFNLASYFLSWMNEVPNVPLTLDVPQTIIRRQNEFHQNFTFVSDICMLPTSPPNINIVYIISLLYFVAYITVFIETYALRAQRKISSTFFEQREEERINYLYQKIKTNSEKQHFHSKTCFQDKVLFIIFS
uniref:Dendritic cell-specific transmembrane protein-like domain-containing protein n=1 Tax=Callorhinchus milii TaxID=7868 RepID=A0A4W3J842_CALMI